MKGINMKSSIQLLFDKTNEYTLLTAQQEKDLIERVQKYNDEEARELLYYCNIRLVVSIAKKFISDDIPLEDLIMEGCTGMAKAIKKFDISTGNKFSTYAVYWIRQAMMRYVLQHQSSVTVSVHTQESINKMKNCIYQYEIEYGKIPTDKELVEITNFSLEQVQNIRKFIDINQVVSFNSPVGEDQDLELIDMIECSNSDMTQTIEREITIQMVIENCFSVLNEKEKDIIMLRFGLFGNEPHTLEAISRYYGVTRERIRQIEKQALSKIRRVYKCDRIKLESYEDYESVMLERLCKKSQLTRKNVNHID